MKWIIKIMNNNNNFKKKNVKFMIKCKKKILKYTTISGVEGFDGSKKEAKKTTISKIN